MSYRSRVTTLAVIGACVLAGASACGTSKGVNGSGTLGRPQMVAASSNAPSSPSAPSTGASNTTPATTKTTTPPAAPAAALTCAQTKFGNVGSKTISYNGYHDSIPLGGGVWSGEDGNTVTLQPQCGIGDLDGDGAADAIGVIMLNGGGTGQFYSLVVWRNVNHKPVFWAFTDLSDRTPVASISISGGVATVVYYTRTDDAPMVELNIKRTATYKLSGHKLTETGHSDVPGEYHP
jgi:hypothetical protein